VLVRRTRSLIGAWTQGEQSVGGWRFDVHHAYDPRGNTLLLGTGDKRSPQSLAPVLTTVAGTGSAGLAGDGGPALQAQLSGPAGVALGPDGSLYIADIASNCIRRVDSAGLLTTVAGVCTASGGEELLEPRGPTPPPGWRVDQCTQPCGGCL
jgi:sugar lactone lactonase YvrE